MNQNQAAASLSELLVYEIARTDEDRAGSDPPSKGRRRAADFHARRYRSGPLDRLQRSRGVPSMGVQPGDLPAARSTSPRAAHHRQRRGCGAALRHPITLLRKERSDKQRLAFIYQMIRQVTNGREMFGLRARVTFGEQICGATHRQILEEVTAAARRTLRQHQAWQD